MIRALLFLLLSIPAGAQTSLWLKLETDLFQIYSRTGTDPLQALARQFEMASEILGKLEPGAGLPRKRVKVFIFTSRREFDEHRIDTGASKTGYYHAASGNETIAFLHSGAQDSRVVFHEYAHLAMHRAGGHVPLWLDEGLAELYSSIVVRGGEARWGGPVTSHLGRLAASRLLEAHEFFSVHFQSGHYQEPAKTSLFYAQSWAFSHMLQFAGGYRGGLPVFRKLLASGLAEPEAFERAFRKTQAAAIADLERYVVLRNFEERPLPTEVSAVRATHYPERCSPEEATSALAGLLLQLGKTDRARRAYEELSRAKRSGPAYEKSLGDLSLAQGRHTQARLHYQRALEAGLQDPGLYFEYAMLLRDAGEQPEKIRALLERALELDPNLAGVHQFLGNRALDEGNSAVAIDRLIRATLLKPGEPALWVSLALAYRAGGNRQAAVEAVRRARQLASEETDIRMAESVLEGLESPESSRVNRDRPTTIVPETWKNPKGDSHLEGALIRVDCEGTAARLHVRSGTRIFVFSVLDPRKVLLRNASGVSTELRCGAFDAVKVAVEFLSGPPGREPAGEVTALEFQ